MYKKILQNNSWMINKSIILRRFYIIISDNTCQYILLHTSITFPSHSN